MRPPPHRLAFTLGLLTIPLVGWVAAAATGEPSPAETPRPGPARPTAAVRPDPRGEDAPPDPRPVRRACDHVVCGEEACHGVR